MRKVKKQSGFTLVEIAIVLVIIGLLLGGVLKGQELIESSKIKSMAKDLNGFSAMITSYQDRYRGVPGDDSITANTTYNDRGWAGTYAASTPIDGLIGGGAAGVMFPAATGPTGENLLAIQALRFAGFLEGSGASITAPKNAAGGKMGLTNSVMGFGAQNVVCFSGLTGKQAGALDRPLDDGVNSTGSVRADVTAAPTTTVAITADADVTSPSIVYKESTANVVLCKTL